MKINVLLTGGGGPGYPLIYKALKSSKRYQVKIIAGDLNPYAGNLYIRDWVDKAYVLPPNNGPDFLQALFEIVEMEKVGFLFSFVDEELPLLSKNASRFQTLGCRLLLPGPIALETSFDKGRTFRVLAGKIPMPRTVLDEDAIDLKVIFNRFNGKAIVKARRTRGNRFNYQADDFDELEFYVHRMKKSGIPFLIQEFIDGDEFNVSLMMDYDKRCLYSVCRQKMDPPRLRPNTNAGLIRRIPEIEALSVTTAEMLDLYPGTSNVEYLRSGDGRFHMIEVNGGRHAAQDMNLIHSGINIPEMIIDLAMGRPVNPIDDRKILDGVFCIKFLDEIVVDYDEALGRVHRI